MRPRKLPQLAARHASGQALALRYNRRVQSRGVRRFRVALILGLATASVAGWRPVAQAQYSARGRRPAPARPGPPAQTAAVPRADAPARADTTEVLIERYKNVLRQRPEEEGVLVRLVDLLRAREGGIEGYRAELEGEAARGGQSGYGAMLVLAGLSTKLGDASQAERILEELAQKTPSRAEAHLLLGRLAASRNDERGARQSYERALAVQKGTAREPTLRALRDVCLRARDFECARERHAELVRLAQGSSFVSSELGHALLAHGEPGLAVEEFARVARAAAGDRRALGPALRDLGRAELAAGRPSDAARTLELAARQSEPGMRQEIDSLRVEAHRSLGTLEALLRELEQDRGDTSRLLLVGKLREELGQLPAAVAAYRQAIRLAPRDLDARLSLVRLLELTLDIEGATRELAEVVWHRPVQVDLAVRYVDLLLAAGRRKDALDAFDRAATLLAADEEASFVLLGLAERLEEPARAHGIEAAQGKKGRLEPSHLVELGSRAYRAGDVERARAIWKRLLDGSDPVRGAILHGDTLLSHDDFAGGLESLSRAVTLAPNDVTTRRALSRGLLRAAAAANGGAKRDFEQRALEAWLWVQAHPGQGSDSRAVQSEARRQVVRLYKRTGRWPVEAARLARAFAAEPPDLEAGLTLAEMEIQSRRFDRAESISRRVLEARASDRELLEQIAKLEKEQGKYRQAIATREQLLRLDPARTRQHLQALSELALLSHDEELALKYADRAAALDPSDPGTLVSLGDLYVKAGRPLDAESSYRRALAADPQETQAMLRLARLLVSRGATGEALGVLSRGLHGARLREDVEVLGRQAVTVALSSGRARELEDQLRPLSVSRPELSVVRELLLEVLTAERKRWEGQAEASSAAAPARAAALSELRALADRNVGPLLLSLAGPSTDLSAKAIALLEFGEREGAGAALLEFAEGSAPEALRVQAARAAGRRREARLAPRFRALLDAERGGARGELSLVAVRSLGLLDDPVARRGLLLALGSEDPLVRAEALLWLGLRPEPSAEATLIEIVGRDSEGPLVRAAAAYALGALRPSSLRSSRESSRTLGSALGSSAVELMAASLRARARRGEKDTEFFSAALLALYSADARLAAAALAALASSPRSTLEFSVGDDPFTASVPERLWSLLVTTPTPEERLRALLSLAPRLGDALELTLETSRPQALGVLRALTRDSGRSFLAPFYTPDDRRAGLSPALLTEADAATGRLHEALRPSILRHALGSDAELAFAALGALCPDEPRSRQVFESALRSGEDARFEAAAQALSRCGVDDAVGLVGAWLAEGPDWSRRRRAAQVLETLGQRASGREIGIAQIGLVQKWLVFLSSDQNEVVAARARAALNELGGK